MDNRNLTDDIDRKMAGYEATPPSGLWDDIERALAERRPAATTHRTVRTVRWAAAAAVAALAVTGGALWYGTAQTGSGDSAPAMAFTHTAAPAQPVPAAATHPATAGRPARPAATLPQATDTAATTDDTTAAPYPTAEPLLAEAAEDPADCATPQPADNRTSPADNRTATRYGRHDTAPLYAYTPSDGSPDDGSRVSLTLSAANFLSATQRQDGYAELASGTIWKGDDDEGTPDMGEAMDEVIVGNKGNDVYTEKKHRQPVKVGLSVHYRITRRLSVGTGVVYSYLSSDLVSGTDNYNYTTRQQLQYLGIPLQINYALFQGRRWNVYASGGAMAEKCVKGRSTTDYVVGSKVQSTQHDRLGENRLQYSVNAAAGLQVNATDNIGLYLEPGVSYHFNNHSHITNIYKDTPFNFSLGVGVRYSF